jgi:2-hydroxy-3-oxopropionate reductase
VTDIGFIGLGIMGRPMAARLLGAGHRLFTCSRRPLPDELGGAVVCASASEVAKRAEIVITMLPNTPDVEAVLFGPGGVGEGLSSGKVVIDMSSIAPSATQAFARRIEASGCFYLDAPVSGGEVGAKTGTLTIMVGGREDVFHRVSPLFELMGNNISLIGGHGAGQTTKIANQIIVALTIEAVGEALMFASKAGADPAKVRTALMGGFAASRVLEVHGERMLKRRFEPGFKLSLHAKDLGLALQGASLMQIALPGTAACQQLFQAAIARGSGQQDHSALVEILEMLSNHQLGQNR